VRSPLRKVTRKSETKESRRGYHFIKNACFLGFIKCKECSDFSRSHEENNVMQLHGSEILPGANLGECIELLLSDFYTTKC